MWGFISGLFWLLVCLALVFAVVAFKSYNKLQSHAQTIRERSSNIQVAVSKKLSLINQLIDVVKSFQESEQFTHLKISQDNSNTGLHSAYQQSGAVMTSLQGLADRFPNLKASEQYHRLVDSIQACEADIQGQRERYNVAVREYNTVRLSIPTVFVASMLGFSTASYLEFDVSGVAEPGHLKNFKTDDGERLQQLLSNAGGHIVGASKMLVNQATEVSKLAVETIRDKSQSSPDFFYQIAGGVPSGPVKLQTLVDQVRSGLLSAEIQVAEAGSSTWRSLAELTATGLNTNAQEVQA
ncbi:MAG: LemA family protein [Polaromonas sp.]|nr:LemA family protein [Polaromonas sp.]